MTAIDFPNSPDVDDLFAVYNHVWKWTGVFWEYVGVSGETVLSQLSTLTTEVTTLTSDVETINQNLSSVEEKTDSLENRVSTIESDLPDLSVTVDGLSNTIDGISDDLAAQASEINSINSDIETINSTVEGKATIDYVNSSLGDKAPIDGPTFSGIVSLPATTSIGTVSSIEIGYLDGVSSSVQDQLNLKLSSLTASETYVPLSNPTFGGTVSLPSTTSIGDISSAEIGYLDGVTSSIQTQLTNLDTTKADIESPTFTGTVSGITKTHVGLGNVNNTSDINKPVSTAQQTALDAKANLSGAIFTGDVETTDLVVTGNLTVQGTTTTISASDLKLRDNMIYLNQAGMSTVINATGNGTNVVYTTDEAHGYSAGYDVTVAGVDPSSFNIASPGYSIISATTDTFTVASTVTSTYVSGGTARGKVHSNPDLGWAAGRYDTVNGTGYAHAGMFRDATDGVFKIFDGYEPEPDESVFINTSDSSFSLADIAVADIAADNITADSIVFGDGTEQTSAGVPSLTTFVEKTANYTLDTLAHQDNVVEMNSTSPITFTVPTDTALAWPIGASMDIFQTNTGEVTIAAASGVTLNRTPGNKLRTQWSSATILKRGVNSWVLYGDLKA